MPKMKTHLQSSVTLGIKNQKGLLLTKDKKVFHRMDIHDALRQLSSAARPDLTIVDGIIARTEAEVVGWPLAAYWSSDWPDAVWRDRLRLGPPSSPRWCCWSAWQWIRSIRGCRRPL